MNNEKLFILIDSNAIIHRSYHALPTLTTKKGEVINAVYGFLLVLLKSIREFQPEYIAAAFDTSKPTFRHKKFKEYKIKRPAIPESLICQIPKVKEILKVFEIPIFEKEGFEADDIIASLKFKIQSLSKIIISGDLDLLQLVNGRTKVYLLKKGIKNTILYNEDLVKEKYQGLSPSQLVDFRALRGDSSDNIPGIPGIGEKTTIQLLQKFGTLKNIYQEIERNSEKTKNIKPKLKEILIKYKEQAFLSKELAQTAEDVALDFNLEDCRWGKYNKEKVISILKKFDFYSLIKKLPN